MVTKTIPSDHERDTPSLGKELLRTFPYLNATISEADLFAKHVELEVTEADVVEAIQWCRDQQLVESADERGRIRLTSQGRKVWREANGGT